MNLYTISFFIFLYFVSAQVGAANAQARRSQHLLVPPEHLQADDSSRQTESSGSASQENATIAHASSKNGTITSGVLRDLLSALDVMQSSYFELWQGTWPTSIDWTAAVLGTHISATLSSLTSSMDNGLMPSVMNAFRTDGDDEDGDDDDRPSTITERVRANFLAFENIVNHFFAHTSAFFFGENSIGLRNQAYDDMLWVVLGWLENIKFQTLHSNLHYGSSRSGLNRTVPWHGTQFQTPAAHRARLFYGLASAGWDVSLCGGGMIWNPHVTPYKNAITNELYISASIGMYLYFPGDVINSPFVAQSASEQVGYPHDPVHLQTAIEGYRWLKNSHMTGVGGLYADGFHINGWENPQRPGTGKCDALNTMVYTYNQGVILSGLRGLWLATGSDEYLRDGHELVQKVLRATGWPDVSSRAWAGLGRGGILEDACDSSGDCGQDGQTFKGIFFHHFTEFCRPLRPQEERFIAQAWRQTPGHNVRDWASMYGMHRALCRDYQPWVEHNAQAALNTRDENGQFGMWWGTAYGVQAAVTDSPLPDGAIDYRNHGQQGKVREELIRAQHNLNATDAAENNARTRALDREDGDSNGQSSISAHPPPPPDYNNRGRARTVETQAGGVAVLRALYEWRQL